MASLLSAQQKRNNVESRSDSLLVVFLGETLEGISPSTSSTQVAGPSSLPVVVDQSDQRLAKKANETFII